MLAPLYELEAIVTGRSRSIFHDDFDAARKELAQLRNSRILVIGAAGSIGAHLVKELVPLDVGALCLVDINENGLTELVREIRSSADLSAPDEFQALPIGIGGSDFSLFLASARPFDFIFNLSALKHVRSEKDVYSIRRMLNTNVLWLDQLISNLRYRPERVFSVSSDKAVNPYSLMGASKALMEQVLWKAADRHTVSTSRFANVAFSNGSLLDGLLQRVQKRQPIAAPNNIRRYFISHKEGAQLCLLAACAAQNKEVFIPKGMRRENSKSYDEIVETVLNHLGFKPVRCESETEAKSRCADLIQNAGWPCYFFESDTSGEKPLEEFRGQSEGFDGERFRSVGVVKPTVVETSRISTFLEFLENSQAQDNFTKDDFVAQVRHVVTTFEHYETGKNLDQAM